VSGGPAPADAAFAERVRASFGRQRFMSLIGARLIRVEPGHVQIEMPYREDLGQQHGFIHAGATAAIADSAGGYAAFTLFPADASILTAEFKLNLLAPAQGEKLIATGKALRSGRTLTVCDLEVAAVANGKTTICATGLQTLMCLHGRPDGPPV
jgi:uncharacterized protein (TIGR00369 family)